MWIPARASQSMNPRRYGHSHPLWYRYQGGKENQLKIFRRHGKLARLIRLSQPYRIPPENWHNVRTERCESGRIGQSRKLLSG